MNGTLSSVCVGNAFMRSAALLLQIGRVNRKTSKNVLGKTIQQTAKLTILSERINPLVYEFLIG